MNPTAPDPTAPTVFTGTTADGRRFEARADRTLLQSMEAAGMAWPSACRNGTCRSCLATLQYGAVRHTLDWPGLLPEEKAAGAILPCVALPLSDVRLVPGA